MPCLLSLSWQEDRAIQPNLYMFIKIRFKFPGLTVAREAWVSFRGALGKQNSQTEKTAPPRTGKTLSGVAFTLGAYGVTRALNLLVTVLLARALDPTGMGLVAAALLAVELVDMLRGLGLKETLIYERSGAARIQSTAFVLIMGVALLQAAGLMLGAPLGAALLDDPQIVPMLFWFALLFPITALGTVPEAMLHRQLRFPALSIADIISVAIKAAVSIALIWQGQGVWSIVIGMLVGAASRTLLFGLLARWRPVRPALDRGSIFSLIGYGKHIFFSTLLNFLRMRADQMAIVTAMGEVSLGIYFVASRIPDIVILGVNSTLTKVIFPTFSRLADKPAALHDMYLATIGGCMMVMAPIAVGLIAIAPQAIPLLFGEQWTAAIPVLMALAAAGIPQTIGWTAGDIFKATGRPHLLSLMMLVQIGVTVPLVFAAALLAQDLVWIAAAILLGECIVSAVRLWYMQRLDGISALQTLAAAARPLAAAAGMGLAVVATAHLLVDQAPWSRLAASILAGAIVYPPFLYIIDGKTLRRWTASLRNRA